MVDVGFDSQIGSNVLCMFLSKLLAVVWHICSCSDIILLLHRTPLLLFCDKRGYLEVKHSEKTHIAP